MITKLRRVLKAYSWHSSAIGYCQGLNMIAALALFVLREEVRPFILFTIHFLVRRIINLQYLFSRMCPTELTVRRPEDAFCHGAWYGPLPSTYSPAITTARPAIWPRPRHWSDDATRYVQRLPASLRAIYIYIYIYITNFFCFFLYAFFISS